MTDRRAPVRTMAMLVGVGLAVSACTTGGTAGSSGGATGSGGSAAAKTSAVSIALASDPTTLDPAKGSVAADFLMERMMFDTLVRQDDGGTVIPGLASSWKVTPTSATFTLQHGVSCSDGTALTATDVAKSLSRFADPATAAPAVGQVFGSNKPVITGDDQAGTVTVTLQTPWASMLNSLTIPQTSIVCPAGLANPQVLKDGLKGAGTGPYYSASASALKPGIGYALTARSGYTWGPKYQNAPAGTVPATVNMNVFASESTMANELLSGQLDYAGLTGPDTARFVGKSGYTVKGSPIVTMFAVFNERAGHATAKPAVRTAVAQALSQSAFNSAVTKGTGALINSIASSQVACVNTDKSLLTPYDAAAAKSALKGVKITVEGTNAVAAGAGNEYVQAALQAAGANVTLKNQDSATWSSDVLAGQGNWDVTVLPNLNLTNQMVVPASFFIGGPPPAGRNFGDIQNSAFTGAFQQANATTDPTAQCAAWQSAQAALLSSHDVVPLASVDAYSIYAKRIALLTPDGLFDPSTVRVAG
ncbi:ABC transporter substrate-binding protein [Streptacidiphilus cavernicola]|uniref:ABC transporter substrate-binding protein n=1 Tax=Streptacidiphilus cavernicola TaxID=3342716 RepID=A0ABV6VMV9_9ACTN